MITFSGLGNQGQFGNQLFQIASTIGIAEKHSYSYGFPEWSYQKYFKNPLPKGEIWPNENYYEPEFHYNEVSILDNTNISGYLQSEKYFKHCEDFIRLHFEFSPEFLYKTKTKYSNLLKEKICAIHVRRGDYVTNHNHHALSYEYYLKAMEHFKGCVFLVFSDDIEYCKSVFPEHFIFIEGSEMEDFTLMTLCDNFIIANSTFSWWAAWLSKSENKKIIAPKKWFGPGLKHHKTEDLYCKDWIVI